MTSSDALSRRDLMLALATLSLGLGCSREDKASVAKAAATSELIVAFDGASVTAFRLDPHNSGFAPHNRIIRSIFDSLTRLLPDQTVGPWLAASWTVSPDRTVYEFKLRPDVKFHDGTAFDAEALKWNFDRLHEPGNVLNSRTNLGPYQRSEVLAPDRLRLVLSEPFTPLLRNLSSSKLGIVSPTAVKKHGDTFALQPVGTGPFRFVSLKAGTEIRLARNPDYQWAPPGAALQGPARFEKLTFMNVPEEGSRIAVLQSGQAHAADLIPAQVLRDLRADPRFNVQEKELLNTNYSLWINTSREPWGDDDMRLAVRLALDIDTIVRTIYRGNFPRAWSSLSPSMFGSAEELLKDGWKPDPARAKELLTERGWKPGPDGTREKGGKKLTLRFIDSQGNREKRLDVIQLVRGQLREVGIALVVDSQPPGVMATALVENKHDLAGGAIFHADPDVLRQIYDPLQRLPVMGPMVTDDEIVAWLRQAAREADGPLRAELYQKAQRKIIDKNYAIPIYVLPYNIASSKRIEGVTLDAHGFPEYQAVRLLATGDG